MTHPMGEKFADRLREFRESKRLSQSDLAEMTGLNCSAVSHFESGRRRPSLRNLILLADAMAVSVDYLMGRSAEPASSGPVAKQLSRDLGRMSTADQEIIATFAAMLAEKNQAGKRKNWRTQ